MKTALKAAEIAGEEAEARKEDKISAIAQVEKLEKENQQLVERVMEMKMKEAEKMNEINVIRRLAETKEGERIEIDSE